MTTENDAQRGYTRKWRAANPEKARQWARESYARNKEAICSRVRERHKERMQDPEYAEAYRAKVRERHHKRMNDPEYVEKLRERSRPKYARKQDGISDAEREARRIETEKKRIEALRAAKAAKAAKPVMTAPKETRPKAQAQAPSQPKRKPGRLLAICGWHRF